MLRILVIVLFLLGAGVASAAELQGKSIAFLKELGIDPASPQITGIVNDQVGPYSLDVIAAKRDEDGVQRFVATRNFFHAFVKDSRTKYPPAHLYQTLYLTSDEVKYIIAEQRNRR
jgi:hypothetical protein